MKLFTKRLILLHFALLFSIMNQAVATVFTEGDSVSHPCSDLYLNTWEGSNTVLKTNMLSRNQDYILPLQIEGNKFVFPTANKMYICSPYGMRSGRFHTGMDIKQLLGDSILAVWDGVVRMASKNYYGYGGTVVIRHSNGLETLYAHLSKINVVENQSVKSGEVIGYAGKTGRATTEHLHFEIRFLYEHFDPRIIIDFITFSLKTDTLYIRKGKFFGNSLNFTAEDMEKQMPDTAMITDNFQEEKFSLEEEKIKIDTIIPSKKEFYIVKKGDTLFSISKKTSVSIDVLCKINKIKQESILQIGQKLKLNSN